MPTNIVTTRNTKWRIIKRNRVWIAYLRYTHHPYQTVPYSGKACASWAEAFEWVRIDGRRPR